MTGTTQRQYELKIVFGDGSESEAIPLGETLDLRAQAERLLDNRYRIYLRHEDGSVSVRRYKLEDGAVLLAPDLRAYFPDSEATNRALRGLVEIIR